MTSFQMLNLFLLSVRVRNIKLARAHKKSLTDSLKLKIIGPIGDLGRRAASRKQLGRREAMVKPSIGMHV